MSVKELHIALADDVDMLVDIREIGKQKKSDDKLMSLYAGGLGVNSIVDVIEWSMIWQGIEDKLKKSFPACRRGTCAVA